MNIIYNYIKTLISIFKKILYILYYKLIIFVKITQKEKNLINTYILFI